MPQFEIHELSNPLLEPYREIRSRNWTERSGMFIAEGPSLVEGLISSRYPVKSVLLDRKYYAHYATMLPPEVDVLLVDHSLVESIVGFNFHRGVLGCGLREPLPTVRDVLSATIDVKEEIVPSSPGMRDGCGQGGTRDGCGPFSTPIDAEETIVAVVGVQDPENLGGILRSCAALGIEKVIVGPGTADPLARRVLRVSMGTALRLQLFRSRDIASDLQWLADEYRVESWATSLDHEAQRLESSTRSGPLLILLGNERYGLPREVQAAAARKVRIDMELGTDSLNVSVAAGIILHYFCRLCRHTTEDDGETRNSPVPP